MKFRPLLYNYHDGHLAGFTLGPRRELILQIALDPVWNQGATICTSVRFGGIENYETVASFFDRLPQPLRPDAYLAEVIALRHVGGERNRIVVDLAGCGSIEIHSPHVTEMEWTEGLH